MPILNDILSAVPSVQSHILDAPPNASNTGQFVSGIDTQNHGAVDPQNFIFNAAIILVWVLGILAVLTFIYAGVKYVTAGGDSEKAESAKKMIIGSIIGLILIIGSFVIFNTAISTLNAASGPQGAQQVIDQTYQTNPTTP